MTQQPSSQPDMTTERYPLFTQQHSHSLEEGAALVLGLAERAGERCELADAR